MCIGAAAAIGMGLQLAQGFMQYSAAQSQFKQQAELYKQNALNAQAATRNEYANQQLRISQEQAAAGQKKFETQIETKKAAATTTVAAMEGGGEGLSMQALLSEHYAKSGRYNDAVDNNYQMTRDYMHGEMEATRARGQNQINSVPIPVAPSPFMIFSNLTMPA
jgi:hypothetical protein